MNYYERHLGDYAKDTAHLSMLEHGAYNLLLDRYYSTEEGIPEGEVYRVTRARTRQERAAIDRVLSEFFSLADGFWIKNRVEEEILKFQESLPAAEQKKEHDKERQRRARERRKAMFAELKEHGVVMPWNSPVTALQAELSRVTSHAVTEPVTCDNTASQSPVSSLHPKSGVAAPPIDLRKQLFDLGKSILGADSGSLISRAISQTDEGTVGSVLGEMALKPKADARAYFVAATKPKKRGVVV